MDEILLHHGPLLAVICAVAISVFDVPNPNGSVELRNRVLTKNQENAIKIVYDILK